MYKVGLTGNFYSGYDDVVKDFENIDVPVFDADLVFKYMINYSPKYTDTIINKFGENVYINGLLNIDKFSRDDFNKLFDIIQLDIIKAYEKWRFNKWNSKYTIFKCGFLYERTFDKHMDFSINIYKPKNERKSIVRSKTNISTLRIEDIFFNELDEIYKNQKSNYIIHNYFSNPQSVETQVSHINKSILSKYDAIRQTITTF